MKRFLSRRTIAWLLSVVMTVSVLPVPVFAEDGQPTNEPVLERELPIEETGSAVSLFSLKENQKMVSSDAELEYAIATATGTKEEPTEILLENDITLSSTIKVTGNKSIVLRGKTEGLTIRFSDESAVDSASKAMFCIGPCGEDGELTFTIKNIVLDANRRGRILVVRGNGTTCNLEENAILQNGYTGINGGGDNGGGVRVESDAVFNMKGGLITGCSARFGGAVALASKCSFCMSGGTISDNKALSTYGAGIFNWGSGSETVLIGGTVENNTGGLNQDVAIMSNPLSIGGNITIQKMGNNSGNSNIYVTESLTGKVNFSGVANYTIYGTDGYTVTDEDAKAFSKADNVFYADTANNRILSAAATTVTFHANDGTDAVVSQTLPAGIATALNVNTFTNGAKIFAGWNTQADGSGQAYADGAEVTFGADTDLYAQWKDNNSASGNCGPKDGNGEFTDTAKWAFDAETGVLTVSGQGTTADFASGEAKPWSAVYSDIKTVVIKDGVDRIGQRSFQSAPNLKELTLEGDVIVGDRSFDAVALETLNGQNYITKIEGRAFQLLQVAALDVSNSTEIGEYAFHDATGLKSIKLGNNLSKIDNQAFLNVPVTILMIPDKTEIHRLAFYEMPQLIALKLPDVLPSDMTEQSFWGLPSNCVVYFNETAGAETVKKLFADAGKTNLPLAVLNGGKFADDTAFEAGKLATPVNNDKNLSFAGWYENADFSGNAVTDAAAGKTYYAKWTSADELSGFCGDPNVNNGEDVRWAFDAATGTLTISGQGAMADFADNSERPWNEFAAKITSLELGEGITHIGSSAFNELSNLRGDIVLPESVTDLGTNVFRKSGIDSLDLNNAARTGGGLVFNCSNLVKIDLGKVTSLPGSHTIRACTNLEEVIAENLIEITGDYSFYGCAKLQTMWLPNVEKIGNVGGANATFASSSALKAIVFAKPVEIIGQNQFDHLAENSVVYFVDAASALGANNLENSVLKSGFAVTNGGAFPADITFEAGKLATPQKADNIFDGWYESADFSGNAVTDAVAGKTYYAKWNTASGSITDTATWAFDTETGALTIGGTGEIADFNNPGEQPWGSFSGEIKDLVIAEEITKIGKNVFCELPIRGSVTIPASVKEIDPLAFLGCANITEFVVAEQNTAFSAKNGILYKKLPADRLELVAYPCAKADETFTVPENVTKFGPHAMRYTQFKHIAIPDSVTEFGAYCLNNAALVELTIPATVTAIGEAALAGGSLKVLDLTKFGEISLPNIASTSFKPMAEHSFILVDKAENATQIETYFDQAKTSILVMNGGSFPAVTVLENGRLAPPVKDGHIFSGWFTDAACTTAAPEMAAAGATYYAKWDLAGELTATAAGYTGNYDGEFHTVTVTPSDVGATILYSADNGKNKVPQYKNSGEYVVYYKVQKAGCLDVTGAVLVSIGKIPNPVTITPSVKRVTGGKTVTFTVTAPDDVTVNGITVTLDGAACEEITVTNNGDGTYSAVMPAQTGAYTFTVDASGDKINNSANDAACTVTVVKKTSSGGSSGSSATKPVVGTVVSPVDETMTAEAAKTDANKAAAKADNADDTLALVSKNGTTVSGKDFSQPAILSIPVNAQGVEDVNDLTIARLNPETGKLAIIGGSYDAAVKAVVGYITEAGDYFVVNKGDLITIILQIDNYLAKVNGADKVLDSAPIISQNRTMVPIRFVAETFGAEVKWLEATQTVVITVDGKVLTMTIGKELEGLGAAPVISDNRTMVPLRYISTELEASTVWVPSTKTVAIAK